MDKEIILNEIKKIVGLIDRTDISRDEFLKNSTIPITRRDIEKNFGGWAKAFEAAGFKPLKHDLISNKDLFEEYARVKKKIGHYPLGAAGEKGLSDNSKYAGSTFKKRFPDGLKGFMHEFLKWENEIDPIKASRERTSIAANKNDEGNKEINRYNGRAAEYMVVAELLFKSYNAQILPVDEGLDIMAVKNRELYFIQVKHSSYQKPTESSNIKITISSLFKHQQNNVYYVILLARKEPSQRDFLILPYFKINELLNKKVLVQETEAKQISFKILHTTEKNAFVNEISEKSDVSNYLNAWDELLN